MSGSLKALDGPAWILAPYGCWPMQVPAGYEEPNGDLCWYAYPGEWSPTGRAVAGRWFRTEQEALCTLLPWAENEEKGLTKSLQRAKDFGVSIKNRLAQLSGTGESRAS